MTEWVSVEKKNSGHISQKLVHVEHSFSYLSSSLFISRNCLMKRGMVLTVACVSGLVFIKLGGFIICSFN